MNFYGPRATPIFEGNSIVKLLLVYCAAKSTHYGVF